MDIRGKLCLVLIRKMYSDKVVMLLKEQMRI